MSFLGLTGKTFLVLGVANKKSVAWPVAKTLVVRRRQGGLFRALPGPPSIPPKGLLDGKPALPLRPRALRRRRRNSPPTSAATTARHGVLHSVAFANFSRACSLSMRRCACDFLQATAISAFSLVELSAAEAAPEARRFRGLDRHLLGGDRFQLRLYVADQRLDFRQPLPREVLLGRLVALFQFRQRRAAQDQPRAPGIPGYLHNYLHAEKMTFRKEALKTQEVADTAVWLLSPRSSGVNGQGIVVDAGMGWNFFDEELVAASSRLPGA
jgi:enoyl-[acyl-carrier protein] reductase I